MQLPQSLLFSLIKMQVAIHCCTLYTSFYNKRTEKNKIQFTSRFSFFTYRSETNCTAESKSICYFFVQSGSYPSQKYHPPPTICKKNNFRLETTGSRANVRHVTNFRTLLSSAIVTDYHPLQTKLFTIPISLAALVLFECAVLWDPSLVRRFTTSAEFSSYFF